MRILLNKLKYWWFTEVLKTKIIRIRPIEVDKLTGEPPLYKILKGSSVDKEPKMRYPWNG